MSERVTKAQAINLKKLGYDLPTNTLYEEGLDVPQFDPINTANFNYIDVWGERYISAPTISDAIQWMYDKFEINIAVFYLIEDSEWRCELISNYGEISKDGFKSRPAAQSAGLDAAINYKLKQLQDENRTNA